MKSKGITALVAIGMMASVSNAKIISKNGVAKDTITKLEWQDEAYIEAEKAAYKENTNNGKVGNWDYAKQQCENLNLGGKSDWRLPNIYELTTLLDNIKKEKPYIINGFQNMVSDFYWSSSSTTYKNYAWHVFFYDDGGYVGNGTRNSSGYVRCVRAGQLNFDSLLLLKKSGKIKISQENIDKISQNVEKLKAKQEAQTQSATTRSYNSWTTGYKDKRSDSYTPFSYESTEIKCSDGINGTVFNYYGRDTSYHYIVNVTNSFASFDEAANYVCRNK